MGRPSTFDKDEAYDTIIDLMWREGYDVCSVKHMSDVLGLTRSSFYNAFGSREDMFAEVILRYELQSPEFAFVLASEPINVQWLMTAVLLAICDERAAEPEGRGCLTANMVAQLCARHTELCEVLTKLQHEKTERLQTILGWGVTSKELPRTFNVAQTAHSLMALIAGINIMSKTVKDRKIIRAVAINGLKALGLFSSERAKQSTI